MADKPIEVSEEQLHEDEELIEKLEGQRVFQHRSWEDWTVSIIAFLWSLYQIYVVIVPVNSVFIRATHPPGLCPGPGLPDVPHD